MKRYYCYGKDDFGDRYDALREDDADGDCVNYADAASEIATLRDELTVSRSERNIAEAHNIELRARVEKLEERVPASLLCAWNGAGDPNLGSWHYWATEYPDEGAIGPFDSMAEAVAHGENAGHTFTDWFMKEIDRVRALWKGPGSAAIDAARKGE